MSVVETIKEKIADRKMTKRWCKIRNRVKVLESLFVHTEEQAKEVRELEEESTKLDHIMRNERYVLMSEKPMYFTACRNETIKGTFSKVKGHYERLGKVIVFTDFRMCFRYGVEKDKDQDLYFQHIKSCQTEGKQLQIVLKNNQEINLKFDRKFDTENCKSLILSKINEK